MGDFSIARLAADRFVLIGSGAAIAFHLRWFKNHLPDTGVTLRNISDERPGFSISGPKSAQVLAKITDEDVSTANFRFFAVREMMLGQISAIVARVSFTGELGYEIYAPREQHEALYDTLLTAGQEFGIRHFGGRALDSMRLEKGFGGWTREYTPDYNPFEA